MAMGQKKAEHLARGIGPLRIGVGAGLAPTRPGMAGAVDHPLLEDRLAVRIGMQRPAVGPSTRHLSLLRCRRGLQSGSRGSAGLEGSSARGSIEEIDTAPRLALRNTESTVGSAPSPRRLTGMENPSLTTMSDFRAMLSRPRCAAMAFSADVAT